MSKKQDKTTEPFFAETMEVMGGNIGHTQGNEILWDLGSESDSK